MCGLVHAVPDQLGTVDLLGNNAAYTRMVPPQQLDLKIWRKMFSANVEAPSHLMWLLQDDLRRSGPAARWSTSRRWRRSNPTRR